MTLQDLNLSTTVDGAGNGVAVSGQVRVGTRWRLMRATTSSAEPSALGTVRLFRNSPEGPFIDGTASAQGDVSELTAGGVILHAGEQVMAVWTDCTPDTAFTVGLSVDVEQGR